MSLWAHVREQQVTPATASPSTAHPRLWFTADTLPALRTALATNDVAAFEYWVTQMDVYLATATTRSQQDRACLMADYAYLAQLYSGGTVPGTTPAYTAAQYADKVRELAALISTARYERGYLALAYDWCYNLWSETTRQSVASVLATWAAATPTDPTPFDDTAAVERGTWGLAALAIAGDPEDTADRGNTALAAWPTVFASFVDSAFTAASGYHPQGWSYAYNEIALAHIWLLKAIEARRTFYGMSKSYVYGTESTWVAAMIPWVVGSITPTRYTDATHAVGFRTYLHKTNQMANPLFSRTYQSSLVGWCRGLDDASVAGLCQWAITQRWGELTPAGATAILLTLDGRFSPMAIERPTAVSLATALGTTYRTDDEGHVQWRTGDTTTDTLIYLTAPRYTALAGQYTELASGRWELWRNGPLLGVAGRAVHHSPSNDAWGHNCLVFIDPAETTSYLNVGQRKQLSTLTAPATQWIQASQWDIGGIDRYAPSGTIDVDYAFADLTRAYSSTVRQDGSYPIRISTYTRQYVYFRPAPPQNRDVLVIFDRSTSVGTNYEKRHLIQCATAPVVDGTPSAGPSRNGSTDGRTTYAGATSATITNTTTSGTMASSGKAWVTWLRPTTPTIVVVGGTDHEYETPFGVNMPDSVASAWDTQFIGPYHLEITTTVVDEPHLVIVEATTASDSDPKSDAASLTALGAVAARYGTRVVVFSATETRITNVSVTSDITSTIEIYACDLNPSVAYLIAGTPVTSTSAGTAYAVVAATSGLSLVIEQV